MINTYDYFEEKYITSKKKYQIVKFAKKTNNLLGALIKNDPEIMFDILNEEKLALKMIVDKYSLYKEENKRFLSPYEKNDIYNLVHFMSNKFEKNKDFLPLILKHEEKNLNINPAKIAMSILKDREHIFYLVLAEEYNLNKKNLADVMIDFEKKDLIICCQQISDWFSCVGVVSAKEKFLILLLSLSKIIYGQEIQSSVIMDIDYKNELSEKLLNIYDNPELWEREQMTEDDHFQVVKIIHTFSFFISSLDML